MFQSIEYKHPKFYQVFRIFIVILASIIFAWNLCCFARPAGLFPGGFSGLSLLLQEIFQKFLHIHVPYTLLNVLLNIIPVYIGFKFIGRKFTLYSILTIILSSIFVDILPAYVFTQDAMLNSVFGGLINGFAISLCLNVGTTTGGTDFISILELYIIRKCHVADSGRLPLRLVDCALFDYLPVLQHTGDSDSL